MLKSYDYETKHNYHDKLVNFAREVFPRRRWQLKLLNFPAHEGIENKRWIEFGILAENQFGVEHDPYTYYEFIQRNFGIKMHFMELASFLDLAQITHMKFDIVNLDYEGPLNLERAQEIRALFNKDLLNKPCILATNFLAKRETREVQDFYRGLAEETHHFFREIDETAATADPRYTEVLRRYKVLSPEISSLREDVISPFLEMVIRTCPPEQVYEKLKEKGFFEHFRLPLNKHLLFKEDEESFKREFVTSDNIIVPFLDLATYRLMQQDPSLKWLPATDISFYHSYLMDSLIRGFRIRKWFKGKYHSQRSDKVSTPMYFDILWLEKPEIYRRSFFDFIFEKGERLRLILGEDFGRGKVRLRKFRGYSKYLENSYGYTEAERVDISPTQVTIGTHEPPTDKDIEPEIQPQKIETKKSDEISMPKQPIKYKFSFRDLLPREYRHNSQHFSENQLLRMQHFIDDLYALLEPEKIQTTLSNIKASRWYANSRKPTDTQVYALFDDITILSRNGHIPNTNTVTRVYQAVLNGDIASEVRSHIN